MTLKAVLHLHDLLWAYTSACTSGGNNLKIPPVLQVRSPQAPQSQRSPQQSRDFLQVRWTLKVLGLLAFFFKCKRKILSPLTQGSHKSATSGSKTLPFPFLLHPTPHPKGSESSSQGPFGKDAAVQRGIRFPTKLSGNFKSWTSLWSGVHPRCLSWFISWTRWSSPCGYAWPCVLLFNDPFNGNAFNTRQCAHNCKSKSQPRTPYQACASRTCAWNTPIFSSPPLLVLGKHEKTWQLLPYWSQSKTRSFSREGPPQGALQ